MFVRRPLALACALVLGLSVLAGCGGDEEAPEPKFSDSPSATESASESPSALPSETAARETPEEFMQRYVKVEHQMEVTGDSTEYRKLYRKCAPCEELADNTDEIYSNGGWVRSRPWKILSSKSTEESEGPVVVALKIRAEPGEYKKARSSSVIKLTGGVLKFEFTLRSAEDSWLVAGVGQVA